MDDDRAVRHALSFLIGTYGFDVATYASGEALLEALGEVDPSCVLLDVKLPGMSGTDVLRRLRLAETAPPTICMTGSDRAGLREECLSAGATAYLTKPIGAEELAVALSKVFGHPNA